jgi:hypothetical protein
MKVHLIPSIFNKYHDVTTELLDITFPELNLTLKRGEELNVGRPYPNKMISIAHISGQKALNGFIVDIPDKFNQFSMITRWILDAEIIATHRVNFTITDRDFDIATQDPVMWYATGDNSQDDRWPCEHQIPCQFAPRFGKLPLAHNQINTSIWSIQPTFRSNA